MWCYQHTETTLIQNFDSLYFRKYPQAPYIYIYIYIYNMHTDHGLDTMGSAHNTVTPPHSLPVIYIEILLFRNKSTPLMFRIGNKQNVTFTCTTTLFNHFRQHALNSTHYIYYYNISFPITISREQLLVRCRAAFSKCWHYLCCHWNWYINIFFIAMRPPVPH